MHAEAVNPATGERIVVEISAEELDRLVRAARPRVSKKKLERMIGNLALPSEVKVLLDSFMSATVKIGDAVVYIGRRAVVYIGRRVLEIVFDLCRRFPSFTFSVVVWLVGQLLLMAAPWLTPVLASLLLAIQLLYAWVTDWLRQRSKQYALKGEQGNEMEDSLKSCMRSLSDEPVGREAQEAIRPFSVLNAGA